MKNISKGFSLAEVLLTLTVIGLVASLTIPSLIITIQKISYVQGFKGAYSILNQVTKRYMADNGCIGDLNCKGIFNGDRDQAALSAALKPYLNISRDCGYTIYNGDYPSSSCWPTDTKRLNGNIATITGIVPGNYDTYSGYKAVLSNGMIILLYEGTLLGCVYNYSTSGILAESCGDMYVDINGTKPPNTFGRDTFKFIITRSGFVVPAGVSAFSNSSNLRWTDHDNPTATCDPQTYPDSGGTTCGGRIFEEGWEMNY
jgi:prepilin-type N-terminal cleavage/methylation domain-containing protein